MKKWFTINAKATEPTEILIYEQIGKDWFTNDGVGAKEFAEALAEIPKNKEIVVGINSPGGNVWDGLAIYHQLKARASKVTTRIDGVAASIASVIALAGKTVQMPENALMMIHRAWGMAVGNAADVMKFADSLAKHDGVIAGIYSSKNGKTNEENLSAMEAETWFTGSEAKAFGLADEVTDPVAMAASHDLSKFKNFRGQSCTLQSQNATQAPASDALAPTISAGTNALADGSKTAPTTTTPKTENTMKEDTQAVANPPAAPVDLAPLILEIKGLRDDIKATQTANSLPGTTPITARIENLGNPLVERYNSLAHDKVEQAKLAKGLYNDVRKQLMIAAGCGNVILTPENRFDLHQTEIRNANTVDAALANTILSGDFVTTMRTYTAPFLAFTRRVEMSPVSKRQTLEVPLVSSAGSMATNATNYESGDTTLAPIAVVTAEYSRSFHITRPQTNLGLQLAAHAPTNAKILGEGLAALFTAVMTNANFGADVVIGAASDFSATDLPAILALGKNYTRVTLVIDGGHLAYLLPTSRESFVFGEPGAYGFDGGIYKNNLWTSAATDIAGLVCGPDAIVSAWGMADGLPAGEAISQSTVDVNGFPFGVTTWFSRATREVWSSFQIVGGVKLGDATQAEVLTTQ